MYIARVWKLVYSVFPGMKYKAVSIPARLLIPGITNYTWTVEIVAQQSHKETEMFSRATV